MPRIERMRGIFTAGGIVLYRLTICEIQKKINKNTIKNSSEILMKVVQGTCIFLKNVV